MNRKPRFEKKSPRVTTTLRKLSDRELGAVSGAGKGSGARAQLNELVIVKTTDKASANLFL